MVTAEMAGLYLANACRSLDGATIEEALMMCREWFVAAANAAYSRDYHPRDPDAGITSVMGVQDEWRVLFRKDEPMMEEAWIYKRYRDIDLKGCL